MMISMWAGLRAGEVPHTPYPEIQPDAPHPAEIQPPGPDVYPNPTGPEEVPVPPDPDVGIPEPDQIPPPDPAPTGPGQPPSAVA